MKTFLLFLVFCLCVPSFAYNEDKLEGDLEGEMTSDGGPTSASDEPPFVTPVKKMPCADGGEYKVHLTFDDGPQSPYTDKVLTTLENINAQRAQAHLAPIHVTFFLSMFHFRDPDCNGEKNSPARVKKLNDLVRRMIADGHRVGNHSADHISHAELLSSKTGKIIPGQKEKILKNLDESFSLMDQLRKDVKIPEPVPFRFPYGDSWIKPDDRDGKAMAQESMSKVLAKGYVPTHWDIDSVDWSAIKRKYLPDSVLGEICTHHGGVVLDHDIQKFTANNIGALIESITESGHDFASFDEIRQLESQKGGSYSAFQQTAVWYKNCGGRIGDIDQSWADCKAYDQHNPSSAGQGTSGFSKPGEK